MRLSSGACSEQIIFAFLMEQLTACYPNILAMNLALTDHITNLIALNAKSI